jgi:hypothetical protein
LPFELKAFLAVGIGLMVPWKNPHLQSAAARLALFGNRRSLAPTIEKPNKHENTQELLVDDTFNHGRHFGGMRIGGGVDDAGRH